MLSHLCSAAAFATKNPTHNLLMLPRIEATMSREPDSKVTERSAIIYRQLREQVFCRTDRMFAVLMILQWVGGVTAAWLLTPRTWTGSQSAVHPHVWLAIVFGGVIAALPVWLAWHSPGRMLTRQV